MTLPIQLRGVESTLDPHLSVSKTSTIQHFAYHRTLARCRNICLPRQLILLSAYHTRGLEARRESIHQVGSFKANLMMCGLTINQTNEFGGQILIQGFKSSMFLPC